MAARAVNDSLTILGYSVLTGALMALAFGAGRWERRTIYKPGPPAQDLQPLVDHFLQNVVDKQQDQIREELLGKITNAVLPPVEESVRLVPRYPTETKIHIKIPEGKNPREIGQMVADRFLRDPAAEVRRHDLPPPGIDSASQTYEIWREEQDHWFDLFGDPTKKER
jgi:hypothetical protein